MTARKVIELEFIAAVCIVMLTFLIFLPAPDLSHLKGVEPSPLPYSIIYVGGKPTATPKPIVKPQAEPSSSKAEEPPEVSPFEPPKTIGFTKEEMAEIKKDGYMAYFYRRKYDPREVMLVWNAVVKIFPDYSHEDRLLATRSILAYHWVVYRTTWTHNMRSNLAVTTKYRSAIKRLAKLHQVPPEMVEGIITWENSGGISKRSWAECVGVGQMSWGAVSVAHEFYRPHVIKLKKEAAIVDKINKYLHLPFLYQAAAKLRAEANVWDVEGRHKTMRKQLKVEDERTIPECNIEDAVIYLKLLYNNYGGRMGLAISAYHNGGLNNNDIIRSHLNRNGGKSLGADARQTEIRRAIAESDLGYVDLWKNRHSRDMLNGLRTVFGEITNDNNYTYALGDESDIYPWKVAAAYGALAADEELLSMLINKYSGEWDKVECRGMRMYDTIHAIEDGIKGGWLVPLPKVYKDAGMAGFPGATADYRQNRSKYNFYALPETCGFLLDLSAEYRRRAKNPKLMLPLKGALESRILETSEPSRIPAKMHPHLQGAALNIDIEKAPHSRILYAILKEWYLHDRIIFINKRGERRITVNPRYGLYYNGIYQKFAGGNKAP